ncbi:acyl carrier protein [Cohnella endophytica]|uniref:Acyl carrier protein n=2 Tax=Cohnella endophytica TaxID=2419778 RepID=A0A494XX76_9BACL|nr:acyl carrier protein [Cohnella endophytica]
MNRVEIMDRVRSIIIENLEIQVIEPLDESQRLYDDLNIDSIMVLQLIVYIEEAFDVALPEEDMDPSVFSTVGALVSFIQQLQTMKV